jgi:predicted CoA-substrate-specific enzyme activase
LWTYSILLPSRRYRPRINKGKVPGVKYHLGLDIGSISINTVIMDGDSHIVEEHYNYCHGKPFHLLKDILTTVLGKYGKDNIDTVAITGSGGKLATELIGGHFVNEIVAQSTSVAHLYPQAKTVIEMGGEDSKLIYMENIDDSSRLSDFAMNSICAAGTGSFLDQQAKRLGISIEYEFGSLSLKSKDPPRIAGRCSVFAKSDMIHLQQIATPVYDIVAGLCFAVARNFKSNLAKGKELDPPVVFQGGVAANTGMVRAFREILNISDNKFIVPEHFASMGAIGSLYHILEHPLEEGEKKSLRGLEGLIKYLKESGGEEKPLEPLSPPSCEYRKEVVFNGKDGKKLEVYLGLDVGSLSTNVVLIDKENNVVSRRYLPTAGKPLEAIRKGLAEIAEEVGSRVTVMAAGTTGSGRYLTGDFIGADTIQNEITAQATAAIFYDPLVDTVFEIGGQDSKFISIDDGVIVDFEMNKVCAAGTGSFLEEQAEKLDINIVEEFGDMALGAEKPARLGDRCTVFMESDLNSHQQKGVSKENLVGGLAYSIVHNYLQKVVGNKRVGNHILFQGGVTNNRAVVSAFEKVTGKPIFVPPHFDVTGAIGMAMLAREIVRNGKKTRFKGFDISRIPYSMGKFTCKRCSNQCEIRKVVIEGERKPLFYGGRCERYEVPERKGRGKGIPNLFLERTELLMGDYQEEPEDDRPTIGIPRGLMVFYQQFPFWRTFFSELGFRVVLSSPSDLQLVTKSLEMLLAETCFPVEVMFGHVNDLFEKKVDYIFIPFVINNQADKDNPTLNFNCPWIQTYPFMIRSSLKGNPRQEKLLIPTLQFRYFDRVLKPEIALFMKEKLGIKKQDTLKAIERAVEVQDGFESAVRKRGKEVLNSLPSDKRAFVVLGRPYNTSDPELNLHLIEKLINQNVLPIPVDFLPLGRKNIFKDYPMMYWTNGRKIIEASRIVADDKRFYAVYIGNFRCGPDSFILHYLRKEMQGKPYLQLEVDEHSADAGMITRCEAFLDSLKGHEVTKKREEQAAPSFKKSSNGRKRTIYFPYMCNTAYALAAAVRSCGVDSEVLPMQDERDLELGRMYTSSRECFPMICTTGSFLKKLEEPGFDPRKVSFFMPDHNGPCRFGQYRKLQRIIFNRLGYHDVNILSPSNTTCYTEMSAGHPNKFRITAWRGLVASEMLRKMLQERKPYEKERGETERVYHYWLDQMVACIEKGGRRLKNILAAAGKAFTDIPLTDGPRKPVIVIVGEIFMRDNSFCNGFVVERLEDLGAETVMASVREWITYSTYRYGRDSKWQGNLKGFVHSRILKMVQTAIENSIINTVRDTVEMSREPHLKEILHASEPYLGRHYDGDPPMALGCAALLCKTGISGVVNILPFTCQPGTFISSVSGAFRKDHDNIPWVDVAYDGQKDTGLETRFQAFMHQAKEFCRSKGFDTPRKWSN